MKVHQLRDQLEEYDPDAQVLVVAENGHQYQVEELDLSEEARNTVVIEVIDNG